MRQIILNFHGIGNPGRPLETGEAPYWISADQFFDILDLVAGLTGRVAVGFTFDDGNLSDIAIGAEGLARHGFSAEFFVLAGRIGQSGSLGADDIRDLQAAGHSIGLHGADHVDWRKLDSDGARREYDWARSMIAEITGANIDSAAIPFGNYDRKVITDLRQRGFKRVYSSDAGTWRSGQYPIPRTSVRGDMSMADLEAVVLNTPPLYRRLRRRAGMIKKRWL